MKRAFLTDLGLDTDVIDKIMKEHGTTVNSLKEDLEKVDEYKTQVEELQNQLKDRDDQLKELGEKAKDNEELNNRIKELQDQNKETAKEYQDKLNQQAFEFKLEKALADAKAKNPKAVKALLNVEEIKLDGDKLLGLDDQLKALQESDAYLFGEDAKLGGRDPHAPGGQKPNGITKEQFNEMSYTERMELYNTNYELYQQLSN